MKILELFAGSRSLGNLAESRGDEVFSVDWEQYEGIPLELMDEILEASKKKYEKSHIQTTDERRGTIRSVA